MKRKRMTRLNSLLFSIVLLCVTFSYSQNSAATQLARPEPAKLNDTSLPDSESHSLQNLQPFGYNLFHGQAPANEVPGDGNFPSDYILGPGDMLGIFLGGKTEQHFQVSVSVDGQMDIPTAGIFHVNGLTMAAFKKVLDERLRTLYSDYHVDIMILKPKTIRVSVIGEVNAPGNYGLSALNSVLDAIIIAKGPTKKGSLRDVQVFRGDSLVTHIDLYDFLLLPKGTKDFYLLNGDKIFVPVLRSEIYVEGEVNREAIYELNPNKNERLCDVLSLAGGLDDLAFKQKIEISHLNADGYRQVEYVNFENIDCRNDTTANIIIRNNDRIHVYSIEDQVPAQVVTIHGEVRKPGEYQFEQNMHVSDLLLKAGSLNRSAYLLEAEVARAAPGQPVKSLKVNLEDILSNPDSPQDILLEADDHVFIRRIPDWKVGPLVEIRGEVTFPGKYPIVEDSTTLGDIIKQAGGVTNDALIREAKLIRSREKLLQDKEYERLKSMTREEMSNLEYEYFVMKQNTQDVRAIVVDFYKLLVLGDKNEDVTLKTGDVIVVPKRPNVVFVSGRVSRPGGVLYQPGAKLGYYIRKAGGFAWDADRRKTKIIKVSGETKDDEDIKNFSPGDRIWVPRKPDRNYWKILRDTIMAVGQIATIYLVIHNATRK